LTATSAETAATPAAVIARLDRILGYALPVLLLILAADLLNGIVRGPQWMWNEVRLARSFGPAYGYSLYPGEHAIGPIIGTMHAPFGYLVYTSLAVLKDPVAALLAGCALSALLCFVPLLWIHMHGGQGARLIGGYGFLACSAMVLAGPGSNYSALNIHVDAAAVAAAVLAAGILATARAPAATGVLACSAALGVLSVASKQTMAPIPVALACFLLIAEGPRQCLRYLLLQLLSAALIGAAVLLAFRPPRDLLFNTYTLASRVPADPRRLWLGLTIERASLIAVLPALAVLLAGVLFGATNGARARVNANRWLVFLLAALFQVPFALLGWSSLGGDVNHLGVVTIFVVLTATTGLTMAPGTPMLVQRALLVGIIVASLALPRQLPGNLAGLSNNPCEIACRYEKRHPGRVYFLENPLAVLLADGRLTHFDFALHDRERAGFPVTAEQLAAGVPPHYQLVAYPPTYDLPPAGELRRLSQSMKQVSEPGLEGWYVFQRADDGTR